jgi:phosphatidylserine decarboxylase
VPPVALERGREMGRFNMGSTVIVLFEPGRARWAPGLEPGVPVRMGQPLARLETVPPAGGGDPRGE